MIRRERVPRLDHHGFARSALAAMSLETIHFGPEYCRRALSPEEGGEWGDGNERTGDEASSRREGSETADGRRNPGHGKGSGSRREDSLQGRGGHNRDGIHLALERVLVALDELSRDLGDAFGASLHQQYSIAMVRHRPNQARALLHARPCRGAHGGQLPSIALPSRRPTAIRSCAQRSNRFQASKYCFHFSSRPYPGSWRPSLRFASRNVQCPVSFLAVPSRLATLR